jgi:hypothetical protein
MMVIIARFLREPPVRKTPLHDPVTCTHIRQGLSNTFLPAYPPERGTISYLSPTTCLPTGGQHAQDGLGWYLTLSSRA